MPTTLITGASSGFGRDTALELARRGWRVFATMRDPAKGQALLDTSRGEGLDGKITIEALDVTDNASVERACAAVLEAAGGSIDVLVNNAGNSYFGAFEDLTDAECRRQMDTNFFGALAVTRQILPSMRKAGRGRIVVVTSNAVNSPHPMLSMYAASKWALEGWAEGLAMEVAPFGLDVALVQPGAHRTEFASNVAFTMPEGSAYARLMEAAAPGVANLDRWGNPTAKGALALVEAVCADRVPFRQQVGEDAQLFAALKGATTFEMRAMLLRALVGFPGEGAFTDREDVKSDRPVLAEASRIALDGMRNDPALAATLAGALGFDA